MKNFLECRKDRNPKTNASVEIGAHIAKFSHLGNIAYRTGRLLTFNPESESFVNDPEADRMSAVRFRSAWAFLRVTHRLVPDHARPLGGLILEILPAPPGGNGGLGVGEWPTLP